MMIQQDMNVMEKIEKLPNVIVNKIIMNQMI